jgi:hypothetical protein
MRWRNCGLAGLALAALTYPGTLAQDPGGKPADPRAGAPKDPPPAGVILRFHNGSVVQPAVLLESLEMETKLGKIAIPGDELRKIDFGFRLTEEDQKKLDKAMRDLGSPKYPLRAAATKVLTQLGRLAYPALLEARKTSDLETAKRVEIILKDIRSRVSAERLLTRTTDIVKTSDSTVAGKITTAVLRVKSELFGEIKVPVTQLRELRSMLPGGEVLVALDASRYGNRTSWMVTEFEAQQGTRLEIVASGTINLDPLMRLGGNKFTRDVRPEGTRNLTSGETFIPGQVLGKIGSDGPTFVVGARYSGSPDREGKLYLRVVTIEHANNVRAEGSYQVRISAEPN